MSHDVLPFSRRSFCAGILALLGHTALALDRTAEARGYALVAKTDRKRILDAAARYIVLPPQTITGFPAKRSPGDAHDYYSQADYFWPNPADPTGPYINRDGQSNPDNFNDHRKAMIALSIQMPALSAAWLLTHDRRFGQHAADHLAAYGSEPLRQEGLRSSPRLVHCARHANESQPRIFARGDRRVDRPLLRHHRHAAPGGSSARGQHRCAKISFGFRTSCTACVVRRLLEMDEDQPERHHRE